MRWLLLSLLIAPGAFARPHTLRGAVIQRCLDRAGVARPNKLLVAVKVNRRGRVVRASVNDLPSEEGQRCVVGEIRRLRFPGRARSLVIPVVFVGG